MINNNPILSIICTCYNQEKYISQTLDGFVMQKTNFPIEIIVHDDASTDNTAKIVKEYETKYPELFRNIYQTENQYTIKDVNIWTDIMFPLARGKYIALCEGDDYWTDPYKLQNQVDFLEEHPDYAICFHKVKILQSNKLKKDRFTKVPAITTTIKDLAFNGNYIHTCSCIFRKNIEKYIKLPKDITPGDLAIHLFNTENGEKIWYMKQNMAVYRVHSGGLFRGAKTENNIKNELNFYVMLLDLFPPAISNFLLYRFFLVFSNYYFSLKHKTQKDDLIDYVLGLHPIFDKRLLFSILLIKTKQESNKYIIHIFKKKLIRMLNFLSHSND